MYSFERLTPSHLKHLAALYKSAFHLDVSLEFLREKYDTGRFGAEYIGYLAMTESGTPAAYYGVFPIVCMYGNKKMLCAQSGDTMTHADHRNKGLFVELAKKTYQLAKDEGIKFVFGFPNKNSYPGFVKKLDWKHEENLNLFSIKVTTVPFVKLMKKFSFLKPVLLPYMELVFKMYNKSLPGFANSLAAEQDSYILHDEKFFSYKTYFKSYFIRVNNKAVWFKMDGRLWIGDIEQSTEQEFAGVIDLLRKMAFFAGATEIHFYTHPNTSYDDYMSRLGVKKSELPVGYLDLESGLDIAKVKFQSGDLDMF